MHHVEVYKSSILNDSIRYHCLNLTETKSLTCWGIQLSALWPSKGERLFCRRYKSTLKCFQSPHRQYGATQHMNHKLPIQSFAHHLRHCRLLQVVALHCCMYGKHLTCQGISRATSIRRWPAHRRAHGTMWLGPIPPRKKANVPTLGPRFLVKSRGWGRQ